MNLTTLTPAQRNIKSLHARLFDSVSKEEDIVNWLLTRATFTHKVILVTPEIAVELLKANTKNRIVKIQKVEEYSSFITKGEWALNGETIKISQSGILLDGQHRLLSIADTGVPCELLICSGIEDQASKTIDVGIKRSSSDVLAMEGFMHSSHVGGALRMYVAYKKGFNAPQSLIGKDSVSHSEFVDTAYSFGKEYLEKMAKISRAFYNQNSFLPPSECMAYILLLDELHPTKWLAFFERFYTTIGVGKNTAEAALLSRSIKELGLKNTKTRPFIKRALFIKAFNAYLCNKPVKVLNFDAGKEKYPRFF